MGDRKVYSRGDGNEIVPGMPAVILRPGRVSWGAPHDNEHHGFEVVLSGYEVHSTVYSTRKLVDRG